MNTYVEALPINSANPRGSKGRIRQLNGFCTTWKPRTWSQYPMINLQCLSKWLNKATSYLYFPLNYPKCTQTKMFNSFCIFRPLRSNLTPICWNGFLRGSYGYGVDLVVHLSGHWFDPWPWQSSCRSILGQDIDCSRCPTIGVWVCVNG